MGFESSSGKSGKTVATRISKWKTENHGNQLALYAFRDAKGNVTYAYVARDKNWNIIDYTPTTQADAYAYSEFSSSGTSTAGTTSGHPADAEDIQTGSPSQTSVWTPSAGQPAPGGPGSINQLQQTLEDRTYDRQAGEEVQDNWETAPDYYNWETMPWLKGAGPPPKSGKSYDASWLGVGMDVLTAYDKAVRNPIAGVVSGTLRDSGVAAAGAAVAGNFAAMGPGSAAFEYVYDGDKETGWYARPAERTASERAEAVANAVAGIVAGTPAQARAQQSNWLNAIDLFLTGWALSGGMFGGSARSGVSGASRAGGAKGASSASGVGTGPGTVSGTRSVNSATSPWGPEGWQWPTSKSGGSVGEYNWATANPTAGGIPGLPGAARGGKFSGPVSSVHYGPTFKKDYVATDVSGPESPNWPWSEWRWDTIYKQTRPGPTGKLHDPMSVPGLSGKVVTGTPGKPTQHGPASYPKETKADKVNADILIEQHVQKESNWKKWFDTQTSDEYKNNWHTKQEQNNWVNEVSDKPSGNPVTGEPIGGWPSDVTTEMTGPYPAQGSVTSGTPTSGTPLSGGASGRVTAAVVGAGAGTAIYTIGDWVSGRFSGSQATAEADYSSWVDEQASEGRWETAAPGPSAPGSAGVFSGASGTATMSGPPGASMGPGPSDQAGTSWVHGQSGSVASSTWSGAIASGVSGRSGGGFSGISGASLGAGSGTSVSSDTSLLGWVTRPSGNLGQYNAPNWENYTPQGSGYWPYSSIPGSVPGTPGSNFPGVGSGSSGRGGGGAGTTSGSSGGGSGASAGTGQSGVAPIVSRGDDDSGSAWFGTGAGTVAGTPMPGVFLGENPNRPQISGGPKFFSPSGGPTISPKMDTCTNRPFSTPSGISGPSLQHASAASGAASAAGIFSELLGFTGDTTRASPAWQPLGTVSHGPSAFARSDVFGRPMMAGGEHSHPDTYDKSKYMDARTVRGLVDSTKSKISGGFGVDDAMADAVIQLDRYRKSPVNDMEYQREKSRRRRERESVERSASGFGTIPAPTRKRSLAKLSSDANILLGRANLSSVKARTKRKIGR